MSAASALIVRIAPALFTLSACAARPPASVAAPVDAADPRAADLVTVAPPSTAPSTGSAGAGPAPGTCPPEMAPLEGGGCIDRWEASAGPGRLGALDGRGTTLVARAVAGVRPLVEVTAAQAERACGNAGKRLCTEAEWVAACRGPRRLAYPYGDAFEPRRCHDWDASSHGSTGVTATGSLPRCVSAAGVFDLANNAGELTATVERSGRRVVRGGTFNMTVSDSRCDEDDYTVAPAERHPDVGFRCCGGGRPR